MSFFRIHLLVPMLQSMAIWMDCTVQLGVDMGWCNSKFFSVGTDGFWGNKDSYHKSCVRGSSIDWMEVLG